MSNVDDFNADLNTDFGQGDVPGGSTVVPVVTSTSEWSKLGIINEALINTANNVVVLPRDQNSDRWIAASSIFEQWMRITAYRRDWKFLTKITPLARAGSSPFPGYADVFNKPQTCLYLVNVWRADEAALIQPSVFGKPNEMYDTMPPALDYQVIGDQIHTTAPPGGSFDPSFALSFDAPPQIFGEWIPFPDPSQPWSVGFVAALRLKIEAGLLQSLNEDEAAAARRDKLAEAALEESSSRSDGEEPRKVAFRSRLAERRRRPRYGWTG